MSAPMFEPVTEALAPELAGDPHDDDAQIIDDFFEPASGPADVSAAKVDFRDHSQVSIPRITRLFSGAQQIDVNTVQPIQILPADTNRKTVVLRLTGPAGTVATDYILVADEANKCVIVTSTSNQGGRLYSGSDLYLDGHTGPIFVGLGNVGTNVVISWWAVSE